RRRHPADPGDGPRNGPVGAALGVLPRRQAAPGGGNFPAGLQSLNNRERNPMILSPDGRLIHFIHLTRLHKPVGTVLLLWPALWGLWLAADGVPELSLLAIFIAGGFVMRAAGCAINDYADRHIDAHVARTNYRPLATGKIAPWEALATFVLLSLAGFGLVLLTNGLTVLLAVAGAGIIALYPFMKRHTHLPQVVLGIAWGWSIPM